jgi:hypothetical protein
LEKNIFWGFVAKALVRPFFVVKYPIAVQAIPQIAAVFVIVEEDLLVFDASPEPFHCRP